MSLISGGSRGKIGSTSGVAGPFESDSLTPDFSKLGTGLDTVLSPFTKLQFRGSIEHVGCSVRNELGTGVKLSSQRQ